MTARGPGGSPQPEQPQAEQPQGEQPEAATATRRRIFAALVVILLPAGMLLRLWILGHDALNSDEAVVGLVAQGIEHGHLTAFVWDQAYGGVGPYVVAAVFRVLGPSAFALNLTPILLAVPVAVVTWRVGKRLFPPWVAVAAAVLAWVWPESTLFNSTREYGYHEVGLLAGMVVLLLALRIAQAGARSGDKGPRGGSIVEWALVGLVAGVGWWASPEVAYYLVPSTALLAIAVLRRPLPVSGVRALAAGVSCGAGMLPWLLAGAHDGWATVRAAQATAVSGSYTFRLGVFFRHVLPMLLGLQIEDRGAWEGGHTVGPVLYGVTLVGIAAAAAVVCLRVPWARVLVLFCVVFPFLYAAFPTAWFWNDGRYAIFLTPVLALLLTGALASAGEHLTRGRHRHGAGAAGALPARLLVCCLLLAAAASTLVAVQSTFGLVGSLHTFDEWHTDPDPAVTTVATHLERLGIHDAYAGYWVAYDLEFLSGDRVTVLAVGNDRNPVQGRQVTSASRAAWVFVSSVPGRYASAVNQLGTAGHLNPPQVSEAVLEAWLSAHRVNYTVRDTGPFTLVLPARNVTPAELAAP